MHARIAASVIRQQGHGFGDRLFSELHANQALRRLLRSSSSIVPAYSVDNEELSSRSLESNGRGRLVLQRETNYSSGGAHALQMRLQDQGRALHRQTDLHRGRVRLRMLERRRGGEMPTQQRHETLGPVALRLSLPRRARV